MSDPKKFALYGGLIMLVMGLVAFVPSLYWRAVDLPPLNVEYSYGYFLGQIPMNIFNKVGLIALGLLGIAAANWRHNSLPMSIRYSRFIMVVLSILTVMGLYEQTNTLFGYWPLFGANVIVYGLFALIGGYYGFKLTSMVPHTYEKDTKDFRYDHSQAKRHFKNPFHFGHHH